MMEYARGRKTLGVGSSKTAVPFLQVLGTTKPCLPPLEPSKSKYSLSAMEVRAAAGCGANHGQAGSVRQPGGPRGAGAMAAAMLSALLCSHLCASRVTPDGFPVPTLGQH